jgi:glucose/arabinose dehydrogenase
MRCLHWPELRPVWAVMAAAGCLILAACGGGSSSPAKSASPSATASTSTAEPTSGPAAVAAITANWKTVFNGKAPIPRRLALVQDGSQVAAFVQAQAKTSFGQAATGSTATVSAVTITSPSQATVHYQVLLLGTPLLKNQVGTAIYQDGIWKVAIASFCGLTYLEYPKGSPKLPAACRS